MKPLRSLIFHRYSLSVEFFRGPHLVHFWWNFEKCDLSSIFSKRGIFQRYTLSTFWWNPWGVWTFIDIFQVREFFQRSTLSTFSMNPLRSLVNHRYFLSVKFIRGLYLVHFDETLEKFDLSSIFSKSGIFQRSRLISNSMKLLRCSDFHRCFLNVDFLRGSHLVYCDETLDMFGLSSIFTECGIFQRFTLSKFRTKLSRSWVFHRDFLTVEFFKGLYIVHSDEILEKFRLSSIFSECGIFKMSTLSTFSMKPLRSLVLYRYFPSVEFFKGPHLVHFRWNFEKFGLSSIFSKCGIFQRSTLSTFSIKLLRSLNFPWYFLSSDFFRGPHLVHLRWNSWEIWSFIDIFLK